MGSIMPVSSLVFAKGAGTNYVFLALPDGRLKRITAVNTKTFLQRILFYIAPINVIPSGNVTQSYPSLAQVIHMGIQGNSEFEPVQDNDIDMDISGQNSCIMATFQGCSGATDPLELRAEVEV